MNNFKSCYRISYTPTENLNEVDDGKIIISGFITIEGKFDKNFGLLFKTYFLEKVNFLLDSLCRCFICASEPDDELFDQEAK